MTTRTRTPVPTQLIVTPTPIDHDEREASLRALEQCRQGEVPAEVAVETLNVCYPLTHDPEIRALWVEAAQVAVTAVCAMSEGEISSALYVHMTVFALSTARMHGQEEAIDELLIKWIRHPRSFRAASTDHQMGLYYGYLVQRVADMLGWGKLSIQRDAAALKRFAGWVGQLQLNRKLEENLYRSLRAIVRNFPAPKIWNRFQIPDRPVARTQQKQPPQQRATSPA